MEVVAVGNKEIAVAGYRYLVSHAQVEIAWEIGVELLKMIGGSAASMAPAGFSGSDDKMASALTGAVNQFLGKLDARSSMALMRKILATVEVQGEVDGQNRKFLLNEVGIKSHFHGRIGAMMRVSGEAVAFTHPDFFDAIADGVAAIMTKASEKMGGDS